MISQLAEQLTFVYQNLEYWHSKKLSTSDANVYHKRLLEQGNIITYLENDVLAGYCEVWRVNYEQFGRIVCEAPFFVFDENITDGNIAFISNMLIIKPAGFKILTKQFFEKFGDCDFMSARREKYNQMFKVYRMKKELHNGQR